MWDSDNALTPSLPGFASGELPVRDNVLRWFLSQKGKLEGSGSAFEDVLIRLHELSITSNSPSAAEYVVTQMIGSPSRTVKQEVADTAIFRAYAETMAELGFALEQAEVVTAKVVERLKGE